MACVLQIRPVMPSVRPTAPTIRARAGEAGASLTEVLIVVGIIAVVMAITVLVMPAALLHARADSGAAQVTATLRLAREQAIAQRRNVQVNFIAPDRITVQRVEIPGPGTTMISDVRLEGGANFRLMPGLPDTPDAFGNPSPTAFPGAVTVAFTSTGELVDENGDPVNGTVFLGTAGAPLSARAITVFGPSALIREWRWAGTRWER